MKSLSKHNDQELWRLVVNDNREAFHVIYDRYWSTMLISAYNVLKDHESSKDITQDIFTDLWIRRNSLSIISLSGYLKMAVRNQVFKSLRHGKVRQEHLKTLEIISFADATEQMVNFNEMKSIYEEAVNALPKQCKKVYLLSRKDNLTADQISIILGISPKTAQNQIAKALTHLRAIMSEATLLFIITFLY